MRRTGEIDSFDEFVRPAYSSEMNRKVEALTGIRFEQLETADPLAQVFERFVEWCGPDCEIYSWSNTDREQILTEYAVKGLPLPRTVELLLANWHDYQAEFGALFPFENPMGLKTALDYARIDFAGQAHNGLCDARNTARLYAMTRNDSEFAAFKEKVLTYFRPAPAACTLGDMFDFSKLVLA